MALLLNVNGELTSSSQLRTAIETTSLGRYAMFISILKVKVLWFWNKRSDRRHYEERSYSEKEQSYSESSQKLFISHTITAFLTGISEGGWWWWCVCVYVGGMDILWIFFETHYFLIKWQLSYFVAMEMSPSDKLL